jgi:hypothetical protein
MVFVVGATYCGLRFEALVAALVLGDMEIVNAAFVICAPDDVVPADPDVPGTVPAAIPVTEALPGTADEPPPPPHDAKKAGASTAKAKETLFKAPSAEIISARRMQSK